MSAREPLKTDLMGHVKELRAVVHNIDPSSMVGDISKHHLEYMLDCAEKMTSYGKLNRWLGFIHGVLAVHGFLSIDQLRGMIHDTNIVTENSVSKALILGKVSDSVHDFFYYNREEDEDLTLSELQEAIDTGEVSLEEIGEEFMFHACKHRR